MTSLIDVIFLLLLFFMLSSTFSKFAEIPLPIGASGAAAPTATPLFLRITEETILLNGEQVAQTALRTILTNRATDDGLKVLVGTGPLVTSQRLVDVLTAIGSLPNIALSVLVPA